MKWGLVAVCLILVACSGTPFEAPDIKDDFCGVHMNYQYCKCAFHGDFCNAIDMDKPSARAYVYAEYDAWVAEQFAEFSAFCIMGGGWMEDETCITCDDGYVAQNRECIPLEDAQENDAVPVDCTLPDDFATDWRKYSDIDEVIPFAERSYEAKQAATAADKLVDATIRAFELEYDIAVEQEALVQAQEYKNALVLDLKTNLLKAFYRLSWITYWTANSGRSLGKSYAEIIEKGATLETVGAGMKVMQGVIPGDSALAINTTSTAGKAVSVGVATALEGIDSLGDPLKVATEFTKSTVTAPLPSADITPEEIEILKTQHLRNGLLDEKIEEHQTRIAVMEAELATLEKEIAALRLEIDSWEAKEKSRVQLLIEESC